MLEDSHEWVVFCAGRDLGKAEQGLCEGSERHWAILFQSQLSRALTGKLKRTQAVENAIGYPMGVLRAHLERQFPKGMNWDNYAGNCELGAMLVWHIDHIVPKSRFTVHEKSACFALSNLRPMWRRDNMRKGDRRSHLL